MKNVHCPYCGGVFGVDTASKTTEDTSLAPEAPQRGSGEVSRTEIEVLEGYLGENTGIAVPKVSDYRERFKKHKIRANDVRATGQNVPLVRMDTEMDRFGDLVIGEGLEQEI